MAIDATASIVLETTDEDLLERAGLVLRDHLSPADRQRLHAILVHAMWAASFRPVLTSFVLERLVLPLDGLPLDADST